ncbi:MAG: hypothetical protein K1Y36_05635 [Blastocatellia bacterium]|nr:hypothetical protein [Blastocatellia bacterium]
MRFNQLRDTRQKGFQAIFHWLQPQPGWAATCLLTVCLWSLSQSSVRGQAPLTGGTSPAPKPVLALSLQPSVRFSNKTYRFDNWNTDTGLPQNHISSILQTRDGFIWLATLDGLVRFDGVRFQVFDRNNQKNFISNRFSALFEDDRGTLWAGTEEGGLVRYQDGVFTVLTVREGAPNSIIYSMRIDASGKPLLLSPTAKLYLEGDRLVPAQSPPQPFASILGANGTAWSVDQAGIHWQGRNGSGHFPVPEYQDPEIWNNSRKYLFEDSHGAFWNCALRWKIQRFANGQLTTFDASQGFEAETKPGQEPRRMVVVQMCEDTTGTLWLATTAGLFRFEQDHFFRLTKADGFPSNNTSAVFCDREGSLWVGTNDAGLFRLTPKFITATGEMQGLTDREIYPLLEDRQGCIWIGSTNLTRYSGGQLTTYETGFAKYFTQVQALCEDSRGRLWVGHYGGLAYFEDGKLRPFDHPAFTALPRELQAAVYVAITEDRQRNLWFATNKGVLKYDGNRFEVLTRADGLPDNDIKVLHHDRLGRLWVGTYGGLACQTETGWQIWTEQNGLSSNKVRALYEDKAGTLWIGTYDGGLNRLKNGALTSFSVEQGLFNNGVFCILPDDQGNLWMSCNKGIFRVPLADLEAVAEKRMAKVRCVAFGKQDGMLNSECNGGRQPAGIKARDGKLWFPTMAGVVTIDPRRLPSNPIAPPVVVEAVLVDGKPRSTQTEIRLLPAEKNLEIQYAGLSFIKSDQIRYKYRLESLETEWSEVGTRRAAYYSYLPPGTYRFQVLAANSDGVWNETGAAISVVVIPPVYNRWWFRLLAVAVMVGGGIGLYHFRIAQLRKQHALKESFSQQLLASREAFARDLITSQEQERQRIAAELHDSVGQSLLIIKNRAMLGLWAGEDQAKSKTQLDEISKSVTATIQEVRGIAYNLRPVHLKRLGLTTAIEDMVETVGTTSGLTIDADIAPLDEVFSKDEEIHFFRIIQECLNNVVKHAQATTLELTIHRDREGISIQVKDNGIGFTKPIPALGNGQGVAPLSSLGLTGISERVRMLGGTLDLQSTPKVGTTVSIRIQFKKDQSQN